MGTSEILPFATGGGANVIPPGDWATSPSRSSGFVAGVADPQEANTAWRQSSFVAAMIAAFVVDKADVNVADDGNINGLKANFITALANSVGSSFNVSLWHYGVDSGSTNTVVSNVAPNVETVTSGMAFAVRISNNNTGASTFLPDGIVAGAKPIKLTDGSDPKPKDLRAGGIALLIYDATGDRYQLLNPGQIAAEEAYVHVGNDTGAASTIVSNVLPAVSNYVTGSLFVIKTNAAANGAATANVSSLGVKTVVRADGTPVQAGDWASGEMITLLYDGTNLRLQGIKTSFTPARNLWSQTAAGTYTFTVGPGIFWIFGQVVGGGGGGAGGGGGVNRAGGGGGSGGYAAGWVAVIPGQTITVVVGTGGAGAGNSDGATGSTGGTTSIGAYMQATGGTGGQTASGTAAGGTAGLGSGGQDNRYGANGGDGHNGTNNVQGGAGAASALGGGGRTSTINITQMNGLAPGSGGGGIWGVAGGAQNGGNGAPGAAYIQY